jgi:hypothetical protein
VAKPKSTKLPAPSAPKTRVSHTVDAAVYRRFRIAAAEADMTESQLFEWLVTESLSSVHSRGVPEKLKATLPQVEQGGGSSPVAQATAASFPRAPSNLMSRIGQISRSSGMPVDNAIERYDDESIPA